MEPIEYPCPLCGAETEWDPDCPGYPGTWNGKKTTMVCHPPCGNADEYTCANNDCPWWYREPNNRGDRAQMGIVPPWLKERSSWREEEDEEDEEDDWR